MVGRAELWKTRLDITLQQYQEHRKDQEQKENCVVCSNTFCSTLENTSMWFQFKATLQCKQKIVFAQDIFNIECVIVLLNIKTTTTFNPVALGTSQKK